jgi:hypothetical protein
MRDDSRFKGASVCSGPRIEIRVIRLPYMVTVDPWLARKGRRVVQDIVGGYRIQEGFGSFEPNEVREEP